MDKKGLSRKEMAVLLALVAILGFMTLPVLANGRVARERNLCADNLRQWGVIMWMYSREVRRGMFPVMTDVLPVGSRTMGPAVPDYRHIFPEFANDMTIGMCPGKTDRWMALRREGVPALPFQEEEAHIKALIAQATEQQGRSSEQAVGLERCLQLHYQQNFSYAYMGFGTRTPVEAYVALRCWRRAGESVEGYRKTVSHDPTPLASRYLGAECPYGEYAIDLYDRIEAGSDPYNDVTMTRNGDLDTQWLCVGELADMRKPISREKGGYVPSWVPLFRDGVERYFWPEFQNGPHIMTVMRPIPVMMDVFLPELGASRGRPLTAHPPQWWGLSFGANVLFADGHVEWVRWDPPHGSTFPLQTVFDGDVTGLNSKIWLKDFMLGTTDGEYE